MSSLIALPAGANQEEPEHADAEVMIDGQWVEASIGLVVSQGIPDQESCSFDPELSMSGAAGVEIVISVDGDCVATVAEVNVSDARAEPPDNVLTEPQPTIVDEPVEDSTPFDRAAPRHHNPRPLAPVNHFMWARATVQEQFGVTASEVHVQVKYTRNGGTVYNGNSPGHYDQTSSWPCWTVNNEAYTAGLNGPSSIFIYRRTHFSNCSPPHPNYDLSARATADLAPRHTCNTPVVPTFWDVRCNGGLYY